MENRMERARLREAIDEADAIVVGAGAGLSTAAGFTYSGERFERLFPDFIERYGIPDMYAGGFFPFPTPRPLSRPIGPPQRLSLYQGPAQ